MMRLHRLRRLSGDIMHYFKYVVKGFKGNLSRFIAVIAIVALGVGFLVGLLSASGDLRGSVDCMYDETQMADIHLMSAIGFHESTASALKNENNIVETAVQSEQKATVHQQSLNSRRISMDLQKTEVNRLTLLSGRYPQSRTECVVLTDNQAYHKVEIGTEIILSDISYTVVGILQSPLYFAKEREYGLTGTSRIDLIFYVDAVYQDIETVTDIYIYYPDLKKYNSFSEDYFDALKEYKGNIRALQDEELSKQKAVVRKEIYAEIYSAVSLDISNQFREAGVSEELIATMVEQEMMKEDIQSFVQSQTDARLEQLLTESGSAWFILDKKSNLSYISFAQNADKIDKIAVVFPIFFYFIAALVALTTITRLVEEERTSIGLLKSLGYSKMKITGKYIAYGLTCSVIGSVVGIILGIFVLPYVIYVAFNTLYFLPSCIFRFNVLVITVSVMVMIGTILCVALYVALKTLKERPCALLLPKAPKPGKRILLERIPLLWKKTKFKYKNTLRNIFRYKKNLIMMIIGVGGCVSLLLCAFGIRNSIGTIGGSQYRDILKYDIKVQTEADKELDTESIHGIEAYIHLRIDEVNINGDTEYDIYKITCDASLESFIHLTTKKGKKIELTENDIVISTQLADKFKLSKGSVFRLEGDDTEYTVSAICDNHIQNYIFVYSTESFEKNAYLLNLSSDTVEEDVAEALSGLSGIRSIEIKSQLSTSYDSMADSLTLIVLVIILCSGALAVIVIYNLTNININERIKEIATLKVLGYQKKEVCGYIYREIFLMCMLGTLAGFIFGPFLFRFIMDNIQSPGLVFSNTLSPLYFLYSFLITIVFIGIVDLLFIPKIKRIKMAESLKCVD